MIPRFTRFLALAPISMLALALLVLVSPGRPANAVGMTFTVNNAGDTNDDTCDLADCTLREAIEAANFSPGLDTIAFDPSVSLVTPQTNLPRISSRDGIVLDGTGADPTIQEFPMTTMPIGLFFITSTGEPLQNVTIRNLTVSGFDRAIDVCSGTTGSDCTYDIDGVTLTNVTATDYGPSAIRIRGAKVQNVEFDGGHVSNSATPGQGAIWVGGSNDVTDVTITDSVISDIKSDGIVISAGGKLSHATVSRNSLSNIGATGISLGSGKAAVDLEISDNTVSGGGYNGIFVQGGGTGSSLSDTAIDDNTVTDTGANGFPFAITGYGIVLISGTSVPVSISRNSISLSRKDGILVSGAAATVSRNHTFQNAQLGIDLNASGDADPGVTPNDPGDADSLNSNPLLNFPVLLSDNGQAVHGGACGGCTIELFLSDNDPSGYGEGQQFIADATAQGNGDFEVLVCEENLLAGTKVTTTATDTQGNTSEFSLNYTLTVPSGACPATPTPSPTPTSTPTPTATPTHTPAPTPTSSGTPPAELTQGNVDCANGVTSVDSLKELRYVAQLSVSQTEPCPDIGTDVASFWGDVDCTGSVTAVDALKILRYVAALPVTQTEPCADIGTPEN